MKLICLTLAFFAMSAHASFTTINGVVLCNCLPKVDAECRSQCESRFYQSRFNQDGDDFCQCC